MALQRGGGFWQDGPGQGMDKNKSKDIKQTYQFIITDGLCRAVEIPCPTGPISLGTSKQFLFHYENKPIQIY